MGSSSLRVETLVHTYSHRLFQALAAFGSALSVQFCARAGRSRGWCVHALPGMLGCPLSGPTGPGGGGPMGAAGPWLQFWVRGAT